MSVLREEKIFTHDDGESLAVTINKLHSPQIFAPDVLEGELEWMEEGRCRSSSNPDLWFPEQPYDDEQRRKVRIARALCASCPVAEECITYAHENNIKFGIWGGTTERERRTMRSKRWRSMSDRQREAFRLGRMGVEQGEDAA